MLREIYAAIPSPGCKGLCVDQCTTVPVFSFELEQLEKATSRKLPTMSAGDAIGGLPLLVFGRCGAYEHRPLICRAYGSVEGLRCPHGCRPAELVTRDAQYDYFERVSEL